MAEPRRARLLAWSVHLLTAGGAVLAMLALAATARGDEQLAFAWLFAALIVDGIDGTLARKWRVKAVLPRIDGDALDLVVDYLSYVFVPAFLLWRGLYFPPALAPWLVALILLSALYTFARTDMKTADGYFRGFPALWVVVAFYLFVLRPDPILAAIVVVVLAIATFAPIHVVHPFRVRDYGWWLPATAIAWGVSTALLLIPNLGGQPHDSLLILSLATAGILVLLGFWRTLKGTRI